jgi:hypothetical protein
VGFELVTIVFGLGLVWATKGSFKKLTEMHLYWWILAVLGLVLRIVAQYGPIPKDQF